MVAKTGPGQRSLGVGGTAVACSTGWSRSPWGAGIALHALWLPLILASLYHQDQACAWCARGPMGAGVGPEHGVRGRPLWTEGTLSLRLLGEWGLVLTKSHLCAGDVPPAARIAPNTSPQEARAGSPLPRAVES